MVACHKAVVLGLSGGLWASGVLGHPGGHESVQDVEARAVEHQHAGRAMADCAEKHQANGLAKRNAGRRAARAEAIRKERNIVSDSWATNKRSLKSLSEDHNQTMDMVGLNPDGLGSVIFDGSNPMCILASEAMVGPFYVDGGLIRNNVAEQEAGIKMDIDLQIIDMTTCEPMPDTYVDFWQSNSTGVYSGVVTEPNGNADDSSNWDNTFGRGIAPTDADGVVQFNTLFPGHYIGRTIHIHVIAHQEGTVLPNNTFESGRASHVGQIYFDQDLISEVEANAPYTDNQQPLTTNDQDFIVRMQLESSDADPYADYVYLGEDVSEGIYAWTTLVVNPEASFDTPAVAHWTEDGGVAAENGGGLGIPGSWEVGS